MRKGMGTVRRTQLPTLRLLLAPLRACPRASKVIQRGRSSHAGTGSVLTLTVTLTLTRHERHERRAARKAHEVGEEVDATTAGVADGRSSPLPTLDVAPRLREYNRSSCFSPVPADD